jgi:hypothetical protein
LVGDQLADFVLKKFDEPGRALKPRALSFSR